MYIGVEIIGQLGQKDMLLERTLAIKILLHSTQVSCVLFGGGVGDEKKALKVSS